MKQATIEYANRITNALSNFQELLRVDTADAVATKSPIELIRHFDDVRKTAELVKKAREYLDEAEKKLSREYIPDLFREQGLKTITIEGVGRASLNNRWSCSIVDGKREEGFNWLRETGNGALIIETVNSSTLSSFAKEYNEEHGKELPSDIFKTGTMTYTSITKA